MLKGNLKLVKIVERSHIGGTGRQYHTGKPGCQFFNRGSRRGSRGCQFCELSEHTLFHCIGGFQRCAGGCRAAIGWWGGCRASRSCEPRLRFGLLFLGVKQVANPHHCCAFPALVEKLTNLLVIQWCV